MRRDGLPLPLEVARLKGDLAEYVGRARGRADTTIRPDSGGMTDANEEQLLSVEEAAGLMGISADGIRKSCRRGKLALAARKIRGQWWIPRPDVLAVLGGER